MKPRLGIIGLGRVGQPAAQAFLKAGYDVCGYARRPEVIEKFQALGGRHLESPAEVARACDIIIILVLNDEQVSDVLTGEQGVLEGASPGQAVICMSTINRSNLEAAAQKCQAAGLDFVDCPFTGGPARVPGGSLTLIAAAPDAVLERCRPVLEVIGRIVRAGDSPGQGQSIKHCNQLFVGVTHAGVMETIMLARKLGLDPEMVCQVVGSGIAGSDYFRLLADGVLKGAPSPGGLGQMCKDVTIAVETGRQVKLPLYVATAAFHYFLAAEAMGLTGNEAADLIKVLENISGQDFRA